LLNFSTSYLLIFRFKGCLLLTDEERSEIEVELSHYPYRRAACVEALKVVQKYRGWVADEQIADLSALLGMTVDELDGVATFYPFIFRRPAGRHVIYLCDSVSCWVMGYEELFATLKERLGISLGGTTGDGRFTLLPVSCIGECNHAPAIMIDDDVYGDLEPGQIESILSRYI
jgi:NADH-quinone oxidoreductase subunit E